MREPHVLGVGWIAQRKRGRQVLYLRVALREHDLVLIDGFGLARDEDRRLARRAVQREDPAPKISTASGEYKLLCVFKVSNKLSICFFTSSLFSLLTFIIAYMYPFLFELLFIMYSSIKDKSNP